jgi:hypothetical protein
MNRIFSISIFLYLIGFFSVKLYISDLDMLNISTEQSQILWLLGLVRDIGFWSFGFLIVVHPIFKFLYTKEPKYKKQIFFGVGFNLAFIVFTVYMAFQFYQIPSVINNLVEKRPELIDDYHDFLYSNDIETDELVETTNLMATSFYEDSGVLVKVIDLNGKQVDFIPPDKSIKLRRDMLQADALIRHQAKSMKYAAITNVLILLLSVVSGLFSLRVFSAYNKLFKRDK